MPRLNEAERVKVWEERISLADKPFKKWYEDYNIKNLEEYYLGRQWKGVEEDEAKKRYVINLVFSTIETNKPSLIFQNPQVRMQARPGRADDFGSMAEERAKLCQDTAQTFVDDPDVDFVPETSLSLHEAHFKYGIVEVGYTPDWIDNPDAGKPVLADREEDADKDTPAEPMMDDKDQPVMQGPHIIKAEHLYVKRIPAGQFRVSASNRNKMSRNDWVGYYEWHHVEDIKNNPLYKKGARGLEATGSVDDVPDDEQYDKNNPDAINKKAGMIKVWKIWDIRAAKKRVIATGHDKFLLEEQPFKYLPFAGMKFYEILDSFYPCPPVYQWLGPQDEVNETREAQRAHRRRFYRRYTVLSTVDDDELDKLQTGGDGTFIKVQQHGAIAPIQDAPLSADVWQHLDQTKQDFLTVSGVSGDQRGVAESETATQASIIDAHSKLRESSIRSKVQTWLAEICRLILLTIKDNMTLEFWVRRNVDMSAIEANQGSEVMRVSELWKQIDTDELGDLDLDITIDLSTMSPVTMEAEKQSWMGVLGILANPAMQMILGNSDVLLKKTLRLFGITSQAEIVEIKKLLQAMLMAQAQAAKAEAIGAVPSPKGTKSKPGETPAEMGGTMVN